MEIHISSGNGKMGHIQSVSLPRTSCRPDAPCYRGCYCARGNFMFDRVQNAYRENLALYMENPKEYENQILQKLPLIGFFRWHVCGDIVNNEYFAMMVRIAKRAREVKFLCFTKKYYIVNDYIEKGGKIPSNLKMVFSAWPGFEMKNPYNMPIAYMYDKDNIDDRIPKTAVECSGKCEKCFTCWNMRKRQSVVIKKH